MRIPRIYVDDALEKDLQIRLDPRAHHHLIHVLRLRSGTQVLVFDGNGTERVAVITQADRRSATVTPGDRIPVNTESGLTAGLIQSVLRGDRMDYALQKSVELGINYIQPIWTERSERPVQGSRLERKHTHWRGVVISACEQCGRSQLPQLQPPLHLTDALAGTSGKNAFVLDPASSSGFLDTDEPPEQLTLACGPEGGLTRQEIEQCQQAGFRSVRLGPRTLRAETAAVAAMAAAQTLWGDF